MYVIDEHLDQKRPLDNVYYFVDKISSCERHAQAFSLILNKLHKMNSRSSDLIRIRPDIKSSQINDLMSDEERFQNETLRPILKMQNDLFVLVFKNYIRKHKNVFLDLSFDQKSTYIENAIQKDIKFRNSLKGIVIGMFSLEEYQRYILNSSALNKRMMNMLIERLKDQMQLFSEESMAS